MNKERGAALTCREGDEENINWICTLGAKNSLKRSFRVSITPGLDEKVGPKWTILSKEDIFLHFSKISPK